MSSQNNHDFIDFGTASPQSVFLESYPEPPLSTSTLYIDKTSNGSERRLVGVHIILKAGHQNGLWELYHIDRAKETIDPNNPKVATTSLEIYCDTLEIHGKFSVPEANIRIFARHLIWATPDAAINTSPLQWSIPKAQDSDGTNPGKDGANGRKAGDFTVFKDDAKNSVVVIYSDMNYSGKSQELKVGSYGHDGDCNFSSFGVKRIASLRIPNGLNLILKYDSDQYPIIYQNDVPHFEDIAIDFKDLISIKVDYSKCFIANGGNGQNPGEGKNGAADGSNKEQKSEYTFSRSTVNGYYPEIYGGPTDNKFRAKFDPPAVYFEYKVESKNIWGFTETEAEGNWSTRDFPTDGLPAIASGKPGNAGSAGSLNTNSNHASQCMSHESGKSGSRAGTYRGGKAGNPTNSAHYHVSIIFNRDFGGSYNMDLEKSKVVMIDRDEVMDWNGTVHISKNGKDEVGQEADKTTGNLPLVEVINETNAWLHPLSLQKVIEYAQNLFLSNSRDEVAKFLKPYDAALSLTIPSYKPLLSPPFISPWDGKEAQWASAHSEIATMLLRLGSHLDYFGNPGGYSPFLSLAGAIKLYEDETKRALRALLLANWISKKAEVVGEKSKALTESISLLDKDTRDTAEKLILNEHDIKTTNDNIDSLCKQLKAKGEVLNNLHDELLKEVQDNEASRSEIKFAVNMVAAICQVIPVGQPVLGSVASLASVASDLIDSEPSGKPDTYKKINEALEDEFSITRASNNKTINIK